MIEYKYLLIFINCLYKIKKMERQQQVSWYLQEQYKQKHPNEKRIPIYKILKPDGTRITQFKNEDGTIEDVITIRGNTKESEKMKKLFDRPSKLIFGKCYKNVQNDS